MDFAYPKLLYLLFAIPIILIIFWISRNVRRARLRKFGNPQVLAHLMPDASKYKPGIKITLQMIALAAIVIMLARPRFGDLEEHQSRAEGIEIMIAFDVSNSMLASATDDSEGISRIDQARILLEQLIDNLHNDKVGLIVFAGEASTQMPITLDYHSAKIYLEELSTDMVRSQGTSLTEAINLAARSFGEENDVHKAIILITDAENHEGDAVEAAKTASEAGIQVDVVGVGTAKGGQIPMKNGDLLRDKEGKVVTTALNEQAAMQIAEAGKGVYVNGASKQALEKLMKSLDNIDKIDFGNVKYKSSAEQFPVFAWIALAFLILDIFVLERKSGWLKKINFFTKKEKH